MFFLLKINLFGFINYRYLNHFAELVDAMHILSSTCINQNDLQKARQLLSNFAYNFELLYGEENMVFNVHLVHHLVDCVEFNGPLFAYSNNCFEDKIGNLVSSVKGTTDVTTQVCDRYMLEKHFLRHIENSPIAQNFYNHIESKLHYSIAEKVAGSLVIGAAKTKSNLNDNEMFLIENTLHITDVTQILEYKCVMLNSETFYEVSSRKPDKRTCDSFVLNNQNGNFAEIKSIFVVDNRIFFLLDEKFEYTNKWKCEFVIALKIKNAYQQTIIESTSVGPKYAFVKFGDTFACSKFPNVYERN